MNVEKVPTFRIAGGSDEDLRRTASLFTEAWLFDVLPRALRIDSPKLFNSDGDEILFHRVTFPLTEAASTETVAARLNPLADLRQASARFWNWLDGRAVSCGTGKDAKGLIFNSSMEDGSPVLGTIELNESFVLFEANSRMRAQRGTAMLAAALADQVASPQTETQTVEQLKVAARRKPDDRAAAMPPEVQEKLVHEVLDKNYHAALDKTHAHVGRCIAARGGAHRPRTQRPRRLAQAPGEPLASHQRPQRSHGHLRFHMDVARTERRASPKLIPSWPFCTASRSLSLVAVEETTLLLAVHRSVGGA